MQKAMAANWNDMETFKLVEIWGEEEIQALLEGCTRNKAVYEKIARGMVEAGYQRTGVQCRDKMKKLKSEYKKVKDNNTETGRRRKAWKFYDCINDVLGNKPATRPAVVIDTLNDAEQSGEEVALKDEPRDVETTDTVVDDGKTVDDAKMAGENASGDGGMEDTDEKLRDDDVRVEQVENKTEVKKERQRRKKRTREDKFEKAMNVIIEKVTKAQKESDEMFMKLEEKRMKLDEHMMEMEDRRLREDKAREELQKREEREFQLRMMMMMMRQQGGMGSPSPPFTPAYEYSTLGSSSSSQQWSESDV